MEGKFLKHRNGSVSDLEQKLNSPRVSLAADNSPAETPKEENRGISLGSQNNVPLQQRREPSPDIIPLETGGGCSNKGKLKSVTDTTERHNSSISNFLDDIFASPSSTNNQSYAYTQQGLSKR